VAEVRAQSKPDAALARTEPAKAEHKPDTRPEPKPEQVKPEHKTASRPEPRPEAKNEPKGELKVVEKPKTSRPDDKPVHPLAADDSARALAILEGKAASDKAALEKSHEAAGEKVVLQVAALGSSEKAAELQARLREAGIHSYTQKISRPGGDLIRVKVGPFSRDEADKVRARLGKLGLTGTPGPA
jgi:DedD protein